MTTVIVILICIVIIIALSLIVYALIKSKKSLKNEIAKLTSELNKANQNSKHLAEYIENMQKIKAEEKTTNQKIEEAKNDEEVLSIIADIINDNNARVCK